MTLTELLVTLALVGVVSMAALGLLEQGQREGHAVHAFEHRVGCFGAFHRQ